MCGLPVPSCRRSNSVAWSHAVVYTAARKPLRPQVRWSDKTSINGAVGTDSELIGGWESAEVPAFRLRDYLTAHGVRHVDVLKIDCEGCEFELVRGCARAGRRPAAGWVSCWVVQGSVLVPRSRRARMRLHPRQGGLASRARLGAPRMLLRRARAAGARHGGLATAKGRRQGVRGGAGTDEERCFMPWAQGHRPPRDRGGVFCMALWASRPIPQQPECGPAAGQSGGAAASAQQAQARPASLPANRKRTRSPGSRGRCTWCS